MDYNMHPFRGGPGGFPDGRPGMFLGPHHHGPGPLMWTLFALELVALLGIVWLVASMFMRRRFFMRHRPWGPGGPHGAVDVLHMRYARGEISREEYLQARDDLGAPPPPPEPAVSS